MKQRQNPDFLKKIRNNTVGLTQYFETPYGKKKIYYFDWTASGRLYKPIENILLNRFGPYVGNTHSESTETGAKMTISYEQARNIIKNHVNAKDKDILLMSGGGTTGAIARLQRIMGFKYYDQLARFKKISKIKNSLQKVEIPVIFVTEMEHHSNQITWLECDCEVVLIKRNSNGTASTEDLKKQIIKYTNRKIKIGSFSACSNVTGILNPVYDMAEIMHSNGGLCFVDFAAAAPYIKIDINPKQKLRKLDAIFFSPHKFLGGPGTPGVLIFDKSLYPQGLAPENPGGGTVKWTDPWGGRNYYDSIETREDGGTPMFLQTIKTALCIKLKEKIMTKKALSYENSLLTKLLNSLRKIPKLHILGDTKTERLGIVSFYIENLHYNLMVKLLNDKYGIQTRGGCSCAGTYGHILFNLNKSDSKKIMGAVDKNDLSIKPGWVRISLHPTLLASEVDYLTKAVNEIVTNTDWHKDYIYSPTTNEFCHKKEILKPRKKNAEGLFNLD